MIDDEYIKSKFFSKNHKIIRKRVDNMTTEEQEYLKNRYNDSESVNETLTRIFHNICCHPLCPICNKPTKWQKGIKFSSTCLNKECIDKLIVRNMKNTCITKYGVDNYAKTDEAKDINRRHYIENAEQISEKRKQTNLKRYGVENCFQSEEKKKKIRHTCKLKYGTEYAAQAKEIIDKVTTTQNKRYGHRFNPTKYRETCLNIYGVDNAGKSIEVQNKVTKTQERLYGGRFNKQKTKETLNIKYNVDHVSHIPGVIEKSMNTAINHNGALFNPIKEMQTLREKYDEIYDIPDNCSLKELHKINMKMLMLNENVREHINNKKLENGTFNTSKSEDKSYEMLKETYPDVVRQYRDNIRYPFSCDFYIPSNDLFIECNYGWTHGKHPYNENNINDTNIIELWKSKNTKYYNNAIYNWTVRDVNKRNTAKQNNLNYIEFWNIEELKKWLKDTI
ncbi:MAG: hypothetical protein J6D03_00570 [Clostridia bacterium]|nr:hypothetical protein [Clostridia bacterium]